MIPIVKVLKNFGSRNVCPTQPLPKLFLFTLTTILKSKPILDFACLGATRLAYIWRKPHREHAVKVSRLSSLGPHGHPKKAPWAIQVHVHDSPVFGSSRLWLPFVGKSY
jgi:hypothetical protein